jgi:single-strand DNA-binding protein
MNRVCLVGRLVKEPTINEVGGYKIAKYTIAVMGAGDRKSDGTPGYDDGFFDLESWGRDAEFVEKYVEKGRPYGFSGQLKQHKWTDTTGNNRYQVLLTNVNVSFLPTNNRDSAPSTETEVSEAVVATPATTTKVKGSTAKAGINPFEGE